MADIFGKHDPAVTDGGFREVGSATLTAGELDVGSAKLAAYRAWQEEHRFSVKYSQERHVFDCWANDHGEALIAQARRGLEAERVAIGDAATLTAQELHELQRRGPTTMTIETFERLIEQARLGIGVHVCTEHCHHELEELVSELEERLQEQQRENSRLRVDIESRNEDSAKLRARLAALAKELKAAEEARQRAEANLRVANAPDGDVWFWQGDGCGDAVESLVCPVVMRADTLRGLTERIAKLEAVLAKISAIRDSIVGSQSLNWSEHVYPLVAALNEAGFEGLDYPEARANVGTLLERSEKLEAENKLLLERIRSAAVDAEPALTFNQLRRENFARCSESFYPVGSRSPNDWIAAIAEEVGEVARICKRVRDGEMSERQGSDAVLEELADVVMYVDLLAARFGLDLGRAIAFKFNVVSNRTGSERRLHAVAPIRRPAIEDRIEKLEAIERAARKLHDCRYDDQTDAGLVHDEREDALALRQALRAIAPVKEPTQ